MTPAAPLDILARTLWGEARGEGAPGMRAVAAVVMNRVRCGGWWGNSVVSVCLSPWQFSCWNVGDPNRAKLTTVDESDHSFLMAVKIASEALQGRLVDETRGATHYFDARMKVRPRWAKGREPCARIGNHIFFKGIT